MDTNSFCRNSTLQLYMMNRDALLLTIIGFLFAVGSMFPLLLDAFGYKF